MKPSESSGKEGGPLGSDSYSQIYAANKLQAAFRGKRGRALAAQKAAGLRNEYSEMMQTMQAATLVQRMWRQWRRRPPAMPVPEKGEDETFENDESMSTITRLDRAIKIQKGTTCCPANP